MSRATDHLRAQAYLRLGVNPETVKSGVHITPQLKQISLTIRRAGQPKVTHRIESEKGDYKTIIRDTEHKPPHGPGSDLTKSWPWYLQASESHEAAELLRCYHAIPKTFATMLPIEAFCLAASVAPTRILEILTGVIVRLGAQASTVIAAVNHPRVVQKTVEMALTDEGIEDRAMLHKATGFLPQPKGSQTTIQVNQNAQANASGNGASAIVSAPPPENTIRRLVNRWNDNRALPEDTGTVRIPDILPHEEVMAERKPATVIVESEIPSND